MIIFSITIKNGRSTIRRAMQSIFSQKNFNDFAVILTDDNSTDDWQSEVADFLQDKRCVLLNVHFNNAVKTRNYVLQYAAKNFPATAFLCRLDCDDELCDENTMSKIENLLLKENPKAALFGNKLRQNGAVIEKINFAKKDFAQPKYLLSVLKNMASGTAQNELPSCNLFLQNDLGVFYPEDFQSAEDHFLCAKILFENHKVLIDEKILYCIYSLDGETSKKNKIDGTYFKARNELYKWALQKYHASREQIALAALRAYKDGCYEFLGKGNLALVFHDGQFVYKVCVEEILGDKNKFRIRHGEKLKYFKEVGAKYNSFVKILDVQNVNGIDIIIEPYEEFSKVEIFERREIISFLADCFSAKIIVTDIKAENFIRTKDGLKLVDIEILDYSDNLFLNMIARAFIFCEIGTDQKAKILARSAINNFALPELQNGGAFQKFANEVFFEIIKRNFLPNKAQLAASYFQKVFPKFDFSEKLDFDENLNLQKFFFENLRKEKYLLNVIPQELCADENLYFTPRKLNLDFLKITPPEEPVSLLIKTCPMEARVIIPLVKHIVRQLSCPNSFSEIVVSIDTKRSNFVRQYDEGNAALLNKNLRSLLEEKIIDKIVCMDEGEIRAINKKYFGIDTSETHSKEGVPVTPQLYAFEQCKSDFVLQMDCDVMIVREDFSHSFLQDMIGVLKEAPNCLSVGFNICQRDEGFKKYFGFENGGFVPEVRFCLLQKSRIEKILPVPNSVCERGFDLTWYRAFERHQKTTGTCSLRGGDSRSFFIHPQNYRKAGFEIWLKLLNRVEQNCIPEIQKGEWDMAGGYYEWCTPKRSEKIVIVSSLRNISYGRFLRFFYSVVNQDFDDWGMVLTDDASENELGEFIRHCIKAFSHKITFIQNYEPNGVAHNTYNAIHYYIENADSAVVIVDGDDALLEKTALSRLNDFFEFQGADLVCGKMYRSDKISPHYKYTCDFSHPRLYGGNVWQHLRAFKKYLYDSLSMEDLQIRADAKDGTLQKFSDMYTWPPHCVDYSYMVPMTEMARNPQFVDVFNYYHERSTITDEKLRLTKNAIIKEILSKKAKTPSDVIRGRKNFESTVGKFIEIDITYKCDLKCVGCNRSCSQAPTDLEMPLSKMENFITESISQKIKWERISILGGEPTLHSQFESIIELLLREYVDKFSQNTIVEIVSNGRKNARQKIERLPPHPNLKIDRVSEKQSAKVDYFSQFNDAPIDDEKFFDADFSKGCWVPSYCGMALNMFGYYNCSVAGGIDRILLKGKGAKSLKDVSSELFKQQKEFFCRYCGNFKDYECNFGNFIPRNEKAPFTKHFVSKTWKEIYENYKAK